jgi:hypothetical protein
MPDRTDLPVAKLHEDLLGPLSALAVAGRRRWRRERIRRRPRRGRHRLGRLPVPLRIQEVLIRSVEVVDREVVLTLIDLAFRARRSA